MRVGSDTFGDPTHSKKNYRHSSFNAVLLYRGILSNAVFLIIKTALFFHLTRFLWPKVKKFFFFYIFFFFVFVQIFMLLHSTDFSQAMIVKEHSSFQKCLGILILL